MLLNQFEFIKVAFGRRKILMSNDSTPSIVRLHGVERSDCVTTYSEVDALVARARQALSNQGMPALPNSAVGSLLARADRLDRDWTAGVASNDNEIIRQADDAARIAEAVLNAIGQPEAREAIRRITKSDMHLSTRQRSQGKDALWELDLMSFLHRRGATASRTRPIWK
jgi:hypothetical protein